MHRLDAEGASYGEVQEGSVVPQLGVSIAGDTMATHSVKVLHRVTQLDDRHHRQPGSGEWGGGGVG